MSQINIKQTDEQGNALKEALLLCKKEQSSFIRDAIRRRCKGLGIEYPPDAKRGKYDRSQIDWRKLAGMDGEK